MTQKYVIGIDGGTQSSKVSIFDLNGVLVCCGVQKLRQIERLSSGAVIHPDDDVWDSIASACTQAMENFPYDPRDILGLGLCTIRCCRVLLNQDGELTTPVISWMDPRLSLPYQHLDQRVAYVTTTSGYIGHRLCGEFKDTAANYEGAWPIDKKTWQWSDDQDVIDEYNVPREMLFELLSPGEKIGVVTADASRSTGLPEGLAVFATANDKAVEALGAGLGQESSVLISLGTYIGGMAYGDFDQHGTSAYFHNMACIPQRYLHESGGVRQGMGTISWFRELLGDSFPYQLDGDSVTAEQCLNNEAEGIAIGCDGLLTLPEWLAPNDQQFKRGAMIGFNSTHTRGHLYRSILESIAMTMKNHIDAMCAESGLAPEQILVSGGGANSDVLMRIFADVFALPALNNQITGAAGLGAAICAAVGGGAYADFDEAIDNMVAFNKSFSPDPKRVIRYLELNHIFKQVSSQTDVINRRLNEAGFQL
ncbi:MAG: sugar (pentulose or hexulose) kinase [Arenicella sp.]|jgi:sugar (pentulose or hexulose) kinase